MGKAVHVGVVGLGRIGRLHAEAIATGKVKNARLIGVSDIVEPLARNISKRLNVDYYTSFDSMLKDSRIDAVIIATPTYLHKEQIIQSLEAGKHVFVEKPMTVSSEEAEEVVKAVEKMKLKLQVGYMRRFDEQYRRAKSIIKEGGIGKTIAFVNIARDPEAPPGWASDPKLSGGIFLDMLSHDFDMACWLLSSEIKEVFVYGGNYIYEEIGRKGDLDVVSVLFRFVNNAQGFIHGARKSVFGYELKTEIYGDKGTIYIGSPYENLFAVGRKDGILFEGLKWFEKRFYDAYTRELNHFITSIIEDKRPEVNEHDGYRAVKIGEACWKSFQEHEKVEVL